MSRIFSRKGAWLSAVVLAVGAAIVGGSVLWHVGSALSAATDRVTAEGDIRISVRPVSLAIPSGLEAIGAPAIFNDALVYEGRLFLAGPSGLIAYDSNGAVAARYRVGIELPSAPVTALAVGLAGDSSAQELWIATAGQGLVAFNGSGFRQILPIGSDSANYAKLTALLPVSTGRILIGTEKAGVLVYDGTHLWPFHPSLANMHVSALAGDDADLWVATLDHDLVHWRAGSAETIADSLPDKGVLSLAASGETVYAGTALGVAELKGGKVTRTLAPGYFAQSLYAGEGKLWMGTLEEGMFEVPLDPRAGHAVGLRASEVCPGCSIRKIFRVDKDLYTLAEDSLWRGSETVLNPAGATLKDRNIAALSMDAGGRLWIGYFDRGLQILSPGSTGRGLEFEDDHLFCVNRIVQDAARGISAVATANGLVVFDAQTARRVIGQAEGLIANQVTDVALRADGSIVAATPAGVSFIDASGISSVYAFQGLVNNHVYTLGVDGSRTLAGTLGGLSILDAGLVKTSYTTANSALKHNWITAMVPVGRDWFVGTYGAGVLRLNDHGRWETFPGDPAANVEINANAMTASPRAVYAGTLDRGLAVYGLSSGRWNYFTAGLPSQNVTAIEARGGILYIGTDNGLVKVPESSVVTW